VALGKILNLGGIDNRPPKTNQSLGRFRVARNVMPTPDNCLIPRYDNAEPDLQPTDIRCTHHIANYDGRALRLVTEGEYDLFKFYIDNDPIPNNFVLPDSPYQDRPKEYPQSVQSYRINNTTYFLSPFNGAFMKYDGVEISKAGCQQPLFSTSSYSSTGTKFVRVVQHVMDFDNNEPVSEYVQFPIAAATTTSTFQVTGYSTPAGFTVLPGVTGVSNVIPSYQTPDVLVGDNYFIGTATYSNTPFTLHFTINATDTNMNSDLKIGSYVFVAASIAEMTAMGFDQNRRALALKVKTISPLILDAKDAFVMNYDRTWERIDIGNSDGPEIAPLIKYGTRHFFTFWESTSATGIYYYKGMKPCFPYSNYVASPTPLDNVSRVTIATPGNNLAAAGYEDLMFLIGPSLNGWYDVNSKKISPNCIIYQSQYEVVDGYYRQVSLPFTSLTKYQGQFLFSNDQYVWFSDSTLGGWIEQSAGQNSLLIGDKEFGRITSICGTSDFLFVGRERKNYYVTGNIATGNYRVQEVSDIEVGPWCNASSILIKDSVVFMTSVGLFQLVSGGKVVKLSDKAPKQFETYNSNSVNEDIVFKLYGTSSSAGADSPQNDWDVQGLAVAYDEFRQLLVFMKREDGNPCFVLHTGTGEVYEWDGMYAQNPDMYANCIRFIKGYYYLGVIDLDADLKRSRYSVEDKTSTLIYPQTNPIKLYTSWLTANEPSLEKELLQLKIFGRIDTTSTAGIKVRHYKDWNINTLITNTTYFPQNTSLALNDQVQYSHKKRLNSDKCLAASVGIEVDQADVNFELESFEVEFNPIQSGMKR